MVDDLLNASAAEQTMSEIEELIASFHPLDRGPYRAQLFSMFDEDLSNLFIVKMDLTPTGGTCNIARATLEPSQRLLDWIAAVRARKLNRNVKQARIS